jgi:formiminotetrahydrofolate cyclodeaminase
MGEDRSVASPADFAELDVEAVLDRLADLAPGPSGGSAAALAGAMAAAVVGMAARASASWDETGGAAAQASALRTKLAAQAREDAAVYAAAREQLELARAGDGDSARLAEALARAAEVPQRIAETACDVALLAELVAARGDPERAPDAVASAALAAGAASAAAHLVAVNLGAAPDDERVRRARAAADEALDAARRSAGAS